MLLLSTKQITHAVALTLDGYSANHIAKELDCAWKTVERVLKRRGVYGYWMRVKFKGKELQRLKNDVMILKRELKQLKSNGHNSQVLSPYKGGPMSKTTNNNNYNPQDYDTPIK